MAGIEVQPRGGGAGDGCLIPAGQCQQCTEGRPCVAVARWHCDFWGDVCDLHRWVIDGQVAEVPRAFWGPLG